MTRAGWIVILLACGCDERALQLPAAPSTAVAPDLGVRGNVAVCKSDCDCDLAGGEGCEGGSCQQVDRITVCQCRGDADCTWFDTGCCFGQCTPRGGQPGGPFCQTDCTATGSCVCANGRCLLARDSDCDASPGKGPACAPSLACCPFSGDRAGDRCEPAPSGACPPPPP
jgi:hypothetical protein